MTQAQAFKLAGIMGMPVLQSRSPMIHNHWIARHGLRAAYGHLPVQVERVEQAVRGLSALGLAGCNITLPHKLHALPFMDWLHPLAQKIGAINCIVVQADGRLHGYNFDAEGFILSLREVRPSFVANAGPIAVLGAGGACRAVLHGLVDQGADRIRLINRTLDKAQALADGFNGEVVALPWAQRDEALAGCQLLVNATNQGMYDQPALALSLAALPKHALVCDLIYVPLHTPLLQAAQLRGHDTVSGLGMLLHQAVPAFEAWFGVRPVVDDDLRTVVLSTF